MTPISICQPTLSSCQRLAAQIPSSTHRGGWRRVDIFTWYGVISGDCADSWQVVRSSDAAILTQAPERKRHADEDYPANASFHWLIIGTQGSPYSLSQAVHLRAWYCSRRTLTKQTDKTRSRCNIVQPRSFTALLERGVRKYQNRAIETAQVIKELIALARQAPRMRVGEEFGYRRTSSGRALVLRRNHTIHQATVGPIRTNRTNKSRHTGEGWRPGQG